MPAFLERGFCAFSRGGRIPFRPAAVRRCARRKSGASIYLKQLLKTRSGWPGAAAHSSGPGAGKKSLRAVLKGPRRRAWTLLRGCFRVGVLLPILSDSGCAESSDVYLAAMLLAVRVHAGQRISRWSPASGLLRRFGTIRDHAAPGLADRGNSTIGRRLARPAWSSVKLRPHDSGQRRHGTRGRVQKLDCPDEKKSRPTKVSARR